MPRLLDDPGLDRVVRRVQYPYPPGAMLDGGKDIDLGAVEKVHGEEVQGEDPLRLGSQEPGPARPVPARRRADPGALENLPHRGRRHGDAGPG